MRIVITGAGFTGAQLARLLVNEKHNVVLIENDEEIARHAADRLDCTVITADGNNLETLEKAGIAKADALVCLTSNDEVNMITCSLVDSVYPEILKIARVRNYAYYVNTAAAKKTHANTFTGKHRPLYGIDFMIHPDVEAADAIVKAVESGAVSNVVTFGSSQMQISRITVMKGSAIAGARLFELRSLTAIPMLVSYIEFDGKPSLPAGSTEIFAGCTLGILSKKTTFPKSLNCAVPNSRNCGKLRLSGRDESVRSSQTKLSSRTETVYSSFSARMQKKRRKNSSLSTRTTSLQKMRRSGSPKQASAKEMRRTRFFCRKKEFRRLTLQFVRRTTTK